MTVQVPKDTYWVINSNDFPACHEDGDGDALVYVDDDSDFAKDKDPDILRNKIQAEADSSAQWLKDNSLVVAGEKSKLLVLATTDRRAAEHLDGEMKIFVD